MDLTWHEHKVLYSDRNTITSGTESHRIAVIQHQKAYAFGAYRLKWDRLSQEFKRLAGLWLPQTSDSRSALLLTLKPNQPQQFGRISQFKFGLFKRGCDPIKISVDISVSSQIACRKLESDKVMLDVVQEIINLFDKYLGEWKERYRSNADLLQSLMTWLYTFDEYYRFIDHSWPKSRKSHHISTNARTISLGHGSRGGSNKESDQLENCGKHALIIVGISSYDEYEPLRNAA